MPDTRPGSEFENGVCLACRSFDSRTKIDWNYRKNQLKKISDNKIAEKMNMTVFAQYRAAKIAQLLFQN